MKSSMREAPMNESVIGRNVKRSEGADKVTGRALYTDDMKFDNCLYGATIRSRVPRGVVRALRFNDGIPWAEFTIVLPEDIPGDNHVLLIENSQPFLAEHVRHIAEPLAVIAHPDKQLVQRALKFVEVVIDEEPSFFEIDDALAGGNIQYGADNIFKSYAIDHGNVASAWSDCDLVLEATYRTPAQEQLYIEPNAIIARAIPGAGIEIWGSMQCPYYIQKALAPLFNLPADKIRVVQMETGGGFGGKEEYPNIMAGHAALLSWKSGGRVVKMIYDRAEDLWATTKRHPSRSRVKAGFKNDGRIVALEIDFDLNGGAYPTLSQTVLSRGILHSFGPYNIPNARLRARVVFTNSNPYGAFRGFGAPQSIFAMEVHLDRAAHSLGIDPAELRRINFLKKGDQMPTGQIVKEEIDLPRLLDRALVKADYCAKRSAYNEENARRGKTKRGISLSVFFHGSGFTGSGEVMLGSRAAVRTTKEGHIEVLSANVEYGQGTNTCFSQIAAEACGIPPDMVHVHQPDTGVVPNSGPTVASRTTMIVGRLVLNAATALRTRLENEAGLPRNCSSDAFRDAVKRHFRERGEAREESVFTAPHDIHWDDKLYKGEAYAAYSWCCDVADVEVDMVSYQVEVKNFVSVVECGKVINPILAKGQIEGGIAQTIGYAVYEDVVMERGEMRNATYTNYIIPTTADVPEIDVEFIEFPFSNNGPFQAKGIGELPADGPAPAIAAATAHALGGAYVESIPLLPEKIMTALDGVPRAAAA